MEQPVETWTVRVDADTSDLETQLAAAAGSGKQFGRAMSSAFQSVAVQGKSLGEALRGLALNLSQLTLQAAFKPLEQGLGGIMQGLLGGIGVGGGSGGSGIALPFTASGAIATPPALGNLRNGATGRLQSLSEAAPSAVESGKPRAGDRTGFQGITVNLNVTTPDADSFRRTETQVAAMLSRAIAQGQRNM